MIKALISTVGAQIVATLTLLIVPFFWFLFELILPLMPYKLAADLLLTKLLLSLLLICISLSVILFLVIKSHNELSAQLKEANFNAFINNPISG